jgi:hypothetical protein
LSRFLLNPRHLAWDTATIGARKDVLVLQNAQISDQKKAKTPFSLKKIKFKNRAIRLLQITAIINQK